jgi:hypothetical protein
MNRLTPAPSLPATAKEGQMIRTIVGFLVVVASLGAAQAQQQVYVYPQKGQSTEQQQKDTTECQQWAQGQTGSTAQTAPQGGQRVRGAARGAAAGAAVGAIAGDAGKGAAIGATTGAVGGGMRKRQEKRAAQAAQGDAYSRAFGACMEGRGYSVK